MARQDTEQAYEEIPYPSQPRAETQPSRLLALGRLHGVPTADPGACRALEVGCGDGGNLLAAACLWPESQFLGIDLAPNHVATARENAAALGITNVRYEVADLADLEPGFETFDCVIAHGVFSWVPRPLQERLLALYAGCLAPNGVGALSLKTYPGWHRLSVARDALRWGAARRGGPLRGQIQAGLELLELLTEASDPETIQGATLRSLGSSLSDTTVPYLVHEYLEQVSDPLRYEELVARVAAHDLQVLCEARLADGEVENVVPPSARAQFDAIAGDDPVARQQLLDLFVDRSFRRPLLVHAQTPTTGLDPAALKTLHFELPARLPRIEDAGIARLIEAAQAAKPQTLGYDALAASSGLAGDALDAALLASLRAGALEPLAHAPVCASEPGERPRAYPYARLCASRMGPVSNVLTERVEMDGLTMALLTRIDGKRDRAALLDQLIGLVQSGAIGVAGPDGSLPSEAQLRASLAPGLEHALSCLAAGAILLPPTDGLAPVD